MVDRRWTARRQAIEEIAATVVVEELIRFDAGLAADLRHREIGAGELRGGIENGGGNRRICID